MKQKKDKRNPKVEGNRQKRKKKKEGEAPRGKKKHEIKREGSINGREIIREPVKTHDTRPGKGKKNAHERGRGELRRNLG